MLTTYPGGISGYRLPGMGSLPVSEEIILELVHTGVGEHEGWGRFSPLWGQRARGHDRENGKLEEPGPYFSTCHHNMSITARKMTRDSFSWQRIHFANIPRTGPIINGLIFAVQGLIFVNCLKSTSTGGAKVKIRGYPVP